MFIWGNALYIYTSVFFIDILFPFTIGLIFTGTNHSDVSAFFCSYAEGYFFSEEY